MIVGYINQEERIFCTDCWPSEAKASARPCQVLDSEEPDDPGDNFWIVDSCSGCGRQVKYKAVVVLN